MNICKNFCLAVIIIFVCSLFAACGDSSSSYVFMFNNETQYTIYITVGSDYRIQGDEEFTTHKKETRITVHAENNPIGENSSITIYSSKAETLDFMWTTDSELLNKHIYSTVSGNTAFFRERQ